MLLQPGVVFITEYSDKSGESKHLGYIVPGNKIFNKDYIVEIINSHGSLYLQNLKKVSLLWQLCKRS